MSSDSTVSASQKFRQRIKSALKLRGTISDLFTGSNKNTKTLSLLTF